MRPMSERRQKWRDAAALSPCGYDWLRAELRDLDRQRDASLLARLRTHLPRKRIMREAADVIAITRAEMDSDLPARVVRDLDGPRGLRTMLRAARTPWERLHAEHAWLLSSDRHSVQDDFQEYLMASMSGRLAALAEQVAVVADSRRWSR